MAYNDAGRGRLAARPLGEGSNELAIERTLLVYIRMELAFIVVGITGTFMFERS